MDGTLYDSFSQITSVCEFIRKEFSLPTIDRELLISKIGLPAEQLFFDAEPKLKAKLVKAFRARLQDEIETDNSVFPDSLNLLNRLGELGVGRAIATSKPDYLAKKAVSNSILYSSFEHVQGVDNFPPKPNPRVIEICMSAVPAKVYAMIGDRPEDVEAGNNVGCYTIGIAQGPFSTRQLLDFGAKETFVDLKELFTNLEDLLSRLKR